MAELPLMLVYKDGDCWRPVTKSTPQDAELAYLIPNDKLPVSVEFGELRGRVKRPRTDISRFVDFSHLWYDVARVI